MSDSSADQNSGGGWDQGGGGGGGEDSVTEATQTSWLQRLMQSFVGMLVGLGFLGGSVFLLVWNEDRAVTAIRALDDGLGRVVEAQAGAADPALQGKLVHLTGPLQAATPPRDPAFGVNATGQVRLRRTLEMYQWRETEHTRTEKTGGGGERTIKTYSYERVWSETPIESGRFRNAGDHRNPPMPARSAIYDAPDARLGAYRMEAAVLDRIDAFKPFDGPAPGAEQRGFRREGEWFYRGQDSANPQLGDMRLKFAAVAAQTASVVAGQADGALVPYKGRQGYTIALANVGIESAADLIHEKKSEEATLTWVLRVVGFVVMLLGFMLVMKPLTLLLAFIPFVEGIVGAGVFIVALTLAAPLTLLTIAFAWLAVRPVVGGGLIVAAVVVLWALRRRGRGRVAALAPQAQPMTAWPR